VPLDLTFQADIWLWHGNASWTFISLPKNLAAQIERSASNPKKPGGTIPVTAHIGYTTWQTSLFKDNPRNTYVLPLKAAIRKKEQLREGQTIEVSLLIETREDPT
jgi:hypothetical protein